MFPDFKLYYKDLLIKTVQYRHIYIYTHIYAYIFINETQYREINWCLHGQIFFDKWGKNVQWGKKHSLQKMMLGKLNNYMQKNETEPYSNIQK